MAENTTQSPGETVRSRRLVTSYRDLGWIVPPQSTTHLRPHAFNFPESLRPRIQNGQIRLLQVPCEAMAIEKRVRGPVLAQSVAEPPSVSLSARCRSMARKRALISRALARGAVPHGGISIFGSSPSRSGIPKSQTSLSMMQSWFRAEPFSASRFNLVLFMANRGRTPVAAQRAPEPNPNSFQSRLKEHVGYIAIEALARRPDAAS